MRSPNFAPATSRGPLLAAAVAAASFLFLGKMAAQPVAICMKPNQVRLVPGASFRPGWFAVDAAGNETPIASGMGWASGSPSLVAVDGSGVFSAPGGLGEAAVTANWNGLSFQTKVKVVADFVSPNAEKRVVKVAMVIIDPPIPAAGGLRFSEKFWPFNGGPMALAQQTRDSMLSVSHGTVDYQFTEVHQENDLSLNVFGGSKLSVDSMYKLFLQPGWPTLHLVAEQQGNSQFLYNDLLSKYNLCEKSNAHQIDEVWVWAMPFIGMGEAAMTGTGAFNINGPVFGGNPCTDLLPIMGFNYERYAGCTLHNMVHRFETTMYQVFPGPVRYTPADPPYPAGMAKNALQEFMDFDAIAPGKAQVGNSHFLPNGLENYDYDNPAPVPSGAANWKRYPLLFNQTAPVGCSSWGCEADCGINSQAWWMRHAPHFKCKDKAGRLNNWWAYFVDFNEGKAIEAQTDGCNCKLFDDDPPVANCPSKGDFPWEDWVSRVKIGDLDNPSGKSQYSDFSSKTLHLTAGTAYSMALSAGFSYFGFDEYFRVWLDKNKDGVFDDLEKIAEGKLPKPANGTPEATLTLPNLTIFPAGAAPVSGMKMRVSMKRGGYPTACEAIPFGEVEDYSVDLGGAAAKPDLTTVAWEVIPANGSCFTNPGQAMAFFGGLARNPSAVAATAFKVKTWLSKDNAIGPGDILWQTNSYTGLAADAVAGLNINSPVPASAAPGRYFALVQIDADNEVAEADESNNLAPFELQVGAPDFVVQNLTGIPASAQSGSGFTVNFEVKNQSPFPLGELPSAGFKAEVFLSSDNVLQVGTDPVIGAATILPGQFNPGGVAAQLAGATVPAGTAAGSYFLFVKESGLCEQSLLNNASPPVPLQVTAPAPCSLTVQVNNVSCSGTTASATVLVTATGGGPQGWIGSYSTPGGVSFVTGAYGTPTTVGVFKNLTATSVPLNIFDPAVPGCAATAAIACPGGPVAYCASKGEFPWEDWIGAVKIGAAQKTSSKSQYSDFTTTSFPVVRGAATPVELTANFSWATYDEYWKIWIDLNGDGAFTGGGEEVFSQILPRPANGTTAKALLSNITLPSGVPLGPARMRVAMKRGAFPSPCEAFPFGEVEDYTVLITDGGGQGGGGADLELTLTADKATASIYSNVNYVLTAKNTGNQPVSSAKITVGICLPNSSLGFSNTAGLVYAGTPGQPSFGSFDLVAQEWNMANLAPGQSAQLVLKLFTMTAAERKVIAFSSAQSPADPDSQPGGKPANCAPAQDDEAVWTLNAGQTVDNPDNRSLPKAPVETPSFRLFPNPAGEEAFIDLKEWAGRPVAISMFNQLGICVSEAHFDKVPAGPLPLDLSKTMNGQYFLKLETPGQRVVFLKLVVMRDY